MSWPLTTGYYRGQSSSLAQEGAHRYPWIDLSCEVKRKGISGTYSTWLATRVMGTENIQIHYLGGG